MKKIVISMLLMCVAALPLALADDLHPPVGIHKNEADPSAHNSGKGMMDMDSMEKRMKDMQAMLEQIHKTGDPSKRQRLIQEHRQMMQEMMDGMHGMMGKGMDGPAAERQQMMEKRMDMMQGMMEQMMEHMMAAEGGEKSRGKDEGAAGKNEHHPKKAN